MKRKSFWGEPETVYVEQVIFAYKINEYRRRYNLSLEEFANVCNICSDGKSGRYFPSEISQYENRKRTPRKIRFQLISSIINGNPTAF